MALKPARLPPLDNDGGSSLGRSKGPSYKLNGRKHFLPSQTVLQPNQDTYAGELETWPAYASRSMSDTNVIGASRHEMVTSIKKNVLPKPKFLEALESYVYKEIIHLDCTDPKPSELRLQAYREVFEYLIGDFKTYRPLLSQIKDEYEKMLSHYRERIRELEPLKSMLVTVSEQCDQKILKIREEERQEIIDLKRKKMELLQHIDERRETEHSLNVQITKLQAEITKQYKMYRDECDMRKLLVSDMNDLRAQLDDMRRLTGQGGVDADDDPVRLKISLKVAREDLSRQAEELNRIKADYGDVVPRRNFEMLEVEHTKLKEGFETLKKDFDQLKIEHDTLLDVHKQVIDQRDEYYTEVETLRRSATPRPQWKKCGKIVPGGPENWKEVCHKKRSAEILDALVNLMKSGGSEGPDNFEGSTEETVPKFLRYEGKIRNRKFSKADVTKLIKSVWQSKTQNDVKKTKLADYLYTYFLEKYNNDEEMAAEWGYSLNEALKNYENEPHIKLFSDILNDQISEEVYYREMEIIQSIMKSFQGADNDGTGMINLEQFGSILESCFPAKSSENREALLTTAQTELESTAESAAAVNYRELFTEDEEGHLGLFITLLLTQEKEERESYVHDIYRQLEGIDPISTVDFKRTLMDLDPQINQPTMLKYISIVFECSEQEANNEDVNVPLETAVARMKKNVVYRHGPVF